MNHKIIRGSIYCCVLISSLWLLGIYISYLKTKESASDFYKWVYPNSEITYNIFDKYVDEPQMTAPQIVEAFENADAPFKKHVSISNGWGNLPKFPVTIKIWAQGRATNGSNVFMGSSWFTTRYVALIRTEKSPGDLTDGIIIVFAERSLFGF